ncbi:hydrocephalus-inducing protein homolog [Cinclus cinclus]|uniref:hydrocephalus-inducing protein homolog n=1 Tax=Cinclus cinclus TaxID=127875 RepID=UPI002E15B829
MRRTQTVETLGFPVLTGGAELGARLWRYRALPPCPSRSGPRSGSLPLGPGTEGHQGWNRRGPSGDRGGERDGTEGGSEARPAPPPPGRPRPACRVPRLPVIWCKASGLLPSKFLKEKFLNVKEVASTGASFLPKIGPFRHMSETCQKLLPVAPKETFIQVSPPEMVFQNSVAHEVSEMVLSLTNKDKFPRLVQVYMERSPYFELLCPNDAYRIIPPGTSSHVRIRFTPDETKDYSHELFCITGTERIVVPIRAIAARAILDFPDQLDFSECPVKYSSQKALLVRNVGNVEAHYQLSTQSPFCVVPDRGTLAAGDTMQVTVGFHPLTVGDHSGSLVVCCNTGECICTNLHGEAVDVNIGLSTNSMEVEKTLITTSSYTTVFIENRSNITARFQWKTFPTEEDENEEKRRKCYFLRPWNELWLESFMEDKKIEQEKGYCEDKTALMSHMVQEKMAKVQEDPMLFSDDIFSIEPMEGEIGPNCCTKIKVTFKPVEALEYRSVAYCNISGRESRLPLRLIGEGQELLVELSYHTLNVGKILVDTPHVYEVQLINQAPIDAPFTYVPSTTTVGYCFKFAPEEGIIAPGGIQTIQISFSATVLGRFEEEFQFSVAGSPTPAILTIKGHVCEPTVHFNVDELDFGDISFGFPYTMTCRLTNPSPVSQRFKLRMSDDGTQPAVSSFDQIHKHNDPSWKHGIHFYVEPREFTMNPSQGTILPQGHQDIEVTLCSNTVMEFYRRMLVDLEGIGNGVASVTIMARCLVPELRVYPHVLLYNECRLKVPYERKFLVVNNTDLPGCYGLIPQKRKEDTPVFYSSPKPCGIVQPHSIEEIPVTIEVQTLGEHRTSVLISVFGDERNPRHIVLQSIGELTDIKLSPGLIEFGVIPLLQPSSQILTLFNNGLIPVDFRIQMPLISVPLKSLFGDQLQRKAAPQYVEGFKSRYFSFEPKEGVIPARGEFPVTVTATLDDTGFFDNTIYVFIHNTLSFSVLVQAMGIGSTIVIDKPFVPELNLGYQFSPPKKKGKSISALRSPETEDDCQSPKGTSPVFGLEPLSMELQPGESVDMVLRGFSPIEQEVQDYVMCKADIEVASMTEKIIETTITCKFIDPSIKVSARQFSFRVEKKPSDDVLTLQYKPLALKNTCLLPLDLMLDLEQPFLLCDADQQPLPDGQPVTVDVGQTCHLYIAFDPSYKLDFHSWKEEKVLKINMVNGHPYVECITLQGEVHFPNLQIQPSILEFGCIPAGTEEVRSLEITNCSPLPVQYHWSFHSDSQVNRLSSSMQAVAAACTTATIQTPATKGEENLFAFVISMETLQDDKDEGDSLTPERRAGSSPIFRSRECAGQQGQWLDMGCVGGRNRRSLLRSYRPVRSVGLCGHVFFTKELKEFKLSMDVPHTPLEVEKVFDISPFWGKLQPGEKQKVSFSFFGHLNTIASVTALCHVEGGPTYEVELTGEASRISYSLSLQEINCGVQIFNEICHSTVTLANTGKIKFNWVLNPSTAEQHLPGVFLVIPPTGSVAPGEKQVLKFSYMPGVPGAFSRTFQLKVAELDPENICLKGEASFPMISVNLPWNTKGNEKNEKLLRPLQQYSQRNQSVVQKTTQSPKTLNSQTPKTKTLKSLTPKTQTLKTQKQKPGVLDSGMSNAQLQIEMMMMLIEEAALELQEKLPSHPPNSRFPGKKLCQRLVKAGNSLDFRQDVVLVAVTLSIIMMQHKHGRLQFRKKMLCRTDHVIWLQSSEDFLVELPEYVLDMGTVLQGYTERRTLVITNPGQIPVSFHINVSALQNTGFRVNLDQMQGLPHNQTRMLEVCFESTRRPWGDVDVLLPIEVAKGPTYNIHLHATVLELSLTLSKNMLQFSDIHVGQCQIETVQFYNWFQIPCEWFITAIKPVRKDNQRKRITPAMRQKQQVLEDEPCPFEVTPSKGTLNPGRWQNLQIQFTPKQERSYKNELKLNVCGSINHLKLHLSGQGLEPRLEFSPPALRMGWVLVDSDGVDATVVVKNPCNFPVEFYSLDFDEQYLEEEKILRIAVGSEYQKNFLMPPRTVGGTLPSEVLEYYEAQKRLKAQQAELKAREEAKAMDKAAPAYHGAVTPSPEPMVEVTGSPISQAVMRHLGIDPSSESCEAQQDRGIVVIVHGPPRAGKTEIVVALCHYYDTAHLSIDTMVKEAIANDQSQAGRRARELCTKAAMELKGEDQDDAGKKLTARTKNKQASEEKIIKKNAKGKNIPAQKKKEPASKSNKKLNIISSHGEKLNCLSCVLPEDLLVDILCERLKHEDCSKGVVFDGLESLFTSSLESSLLCVFKAVTNHLHIYIVNLHQDSPKKGKPKPPKKWESKSPKKGDTKDPKKDEPKAPEKGEPKSPEKGEPKAPEKRDTKSLEKGEPKASEKDEPKTPEKDEPKAPEKEEPKEPKAPEKGEPKAPEKGEPKAQEKEEPKSPEKGELKDVEKGQPKAPDKQDIKAPRIGETKAPDKGEAEIPEYPAEMDKNLIQRFQIYESSQQDLTQLFSYGDKVQGSVQLPVIQNRNTSLPSAENKGQKTYKSQEKVEKNPEQKGGGQRSLQSSQLETQSEVAEGAVRDEHVRVRCLDIQVTNPKAMIREILRDGRLPTKDEVTMAQSLVQAPDDVPQRLRSIFNYPEERLGSAECVKPFTIVAPEGAAMEDNRAKAPDARGSSAEGQPKSHKAASRDNSPKENQVSTHRAESPQDSSATRSKSVLKRASTPTEFHRLKRYRWIVPDHGEVELKVHFSTKRPGKFEHTLRFELVETKRQYELPCSGTGVYPSISQNPRLVFPQWRETMEADEIIFKEYVESTKQFHFGPLLCGKSREWYKAQNCSSNLENLTILNNSPMDVEIQFSFENDGKAETFLLDPPSMTLKPKEKQELTIWAYPTSPGFLEDKLICCIEKNPDPVVFSLCCHGVHVMLEVSPLELSFDKLLLHRTDSRTLVLKNNTLLPMAWQLTGLDDLVEAFSLSQDNGIIDPHSEFEVTLNFKAEQIGSIKKTLRLEVSDTENILGIVQAENIEISAEVYDISLSLDMPEGPDGSLEFGTIHVLDNVKKVLTLKNKGMYNIEYCFVLKGIGPRMQDLASHFTIEPQSGMLIASQPGVNVEMLFHPTREMLLKNKPILYCQVTDASSGEGSQTVATIPVRVTAKAVYSKYSIEPASPINFGAMLKGAKKTQTVMLENRGMLNFKFHILQAPEDASVLESKSSNQGESAVLATKLKSSSSQGYLSLGMFRVSPCSGSVAPWGQQKITVECLAGQEGTYEEQLYIDITGRNPKDNPVGIPFTLIAESCLPGFVEDVMLTFEEYPICSSTNLSHKLRSVKGTGLFVREENKFVFTKVLVEQEAEANFNIYNASGLPCDVVLSIKPLPGKEKTPINNIFKLCPDKMSVPGSSKAVATVTFTPPDKQNYSCTFKASLVIPKSSVQIKPQTLTFTISGKGHEPQVTVVCPSARSKRGNAVLRFKRLRVGDSEMLPLVIRNNGIVPVKFMLHLEDEHGAFFLKGRGSTLERFYTEDVEEDCVGNESKPPEKPFFLLHCRQSTEFDVIFKPTLTQRLEGNIHLLVEAIYSKKTLIELVGEGHKDEFTLDGLEEDTDERRAKRSLKKDIIDAVRLNHIQFGDCPVGRPYRRTFTITNHTSMKVMRFEWEADAAFQFSPKMGHLHPGCAKDITVTLKSDVPATFRRHLVKCKVTSINFELPRRKGQDWDDRMSIVTWKDTTRKDPDASWPEKEKMVQTAPEPEPAPAYTVDESIQEAEVYLSAFVAYTKFKLNTGLVQFKDTLPNQTRTATFRMRNTGKVALEYTWMEAADSKAVKKPYSTTLTRQFLSSATLRHHKKLLPCFWWQQEHPFEIHPPEQQQDSEQLQPSEQQQSSEEEQLDSKQKKHSKKQHHYKDQHHPAGASNIVSSAGFFHPSPETSAATLARSSEHLYPIFNYLS